MAKAGAKKKTTKAPKPKPDFHRQTVLFQWAMSKFGVDHLPGFRKRFEISPDSLDGIDPGTGMHQFYEMIANVLPTVREGGVLSPDRLKNYEQNILEHTQAINTARLHHGQQKIDWKYYQYVALLFTEMYLDSYFTDADGLRREINERIAAHNEAMEKENHSKGLTKPEELKLNCVEPFDETGVAREQLARLAFWCATGSGKTLLLHMHIRQFKHYHKQAHDAGRWPKLDQVILVTPNDGLSRQHAMELTQAGFESVAAGDQGVDGLFADEARKAVKVLDIHKFRDDQGKATVATESFDGTNLILVDEGHRGAGRGEDGKWLERRDRLAAGGFCFEYSATFKEAVQDIEFIRNRYARCILFDYAYRSFYRDGYGKDFTILNLEEDQQQRRYLTAALLLYYQQLKVWRDGGELLKPFRIDKPLWVFVGHTVTGKAATADDKGTISDVVEVLLFLRAFLADSKQSIELIQSLLEEGFVDHHGRNLLAHKLAHLDTSGNKPALARSLHAGILTEVFNAPGGGSLVVQLLKGAEGELALKVGEGEPFGVVNVGDPAGVAAACEREKIVKLEDDIHRPSLFNVINQDDSPVNLLVGSRKFTEGWNSHRVSSIGLMHMGKTEGTQIIQLFGRGVRLRGYRMSLRRSAVLADKPPTPKNMRQVETLQVFGVKATYINNFRDWILSEVPEAMDKVIWDLPVVQTLPDRKLKTLRLKEIIDGEKVDRGRAFHQRGPLVLLRPPHETNREDAWLRRHRTKLNWLPRVRGIAGQDRQITAALAEVAAPPQQKLKASHVALLDIDELLFGLEAFKATRGLDRLHADRASIHRLLSGPEDWYELLATSDVMRLDVYGNRSQWQRMAQQLLNNYAERLHRFVRGRWESPYLEVVEVSEKDADMLAENSFYTIETTDQVQTAEDISAIAKYVDELKSLLKSKSSSAWQQWTGQWRTVPFDRHLYQPLLYVGKNQLIKISPVPLDQHEAKFVEDLAKWCQVKSGLEVYLLRNQSVTGLGFFQASNFFPDFLLWVCEGEREHLAFVDPKGLHHFGLSDPKVQFPSYEVPRLQEIIDVQGTGLQLHGFIVSNTQYAKLEWPQSGGGDLISKGELEKMGVMFQSDDVDSYIDKMFRLIREPVAFANR